MQMPPYRAQGASEWFHQYENDVNHMYLNTTKHLWEILE